MIQSRTAELKRLIVEQTGVSTHLMSPAAPSSVPAAMTELSGGARVVPLEKKIDAYTNAVQNKRIDFMPLMVKINGFALKANVSSSGLGMFASVLKNERTIYIDAVGIYPQFLGRESAFSPLVVSAYDKGPMAWVTTSTIKIAR